MTSLIKHLTQELKIYQNCLKDQNDTSTAFYTITPSTDSFTKWNLILFGPIDTPYEHGIFKGHIEFPPTYPNDPPKVILRNLYHPNVYPNGTVCISILHKGEDIYGYEKTSERWSPILKIPSVMISIISMISDPNFDSPANIDAGKLWRDDYDSYKKKIYRIVAKSLNDDYDI